MPPRTLDAVIGYGAILGEMAGLLQIRTTYNHEIVTLVGLWIIIATYISYFYFLHRIGRYE